MLERGLNTYRKRINLRVSPGQLVVALAGNPNTGKSTLFNTLTGLNQHTGNWPGKTVQRAEGTYSHRGKKFVLIDLPGTYSLLANSVEEQIARDFICFACPDVTVVVTDATCLERNLNLTLQIMEITPKVVLCVNLIDEAERKKILVDVGALSEELGIPAVATAARNGRGVKRLLDVVYEVATGTVVTSPRLVTYNPEVEQLVNRLEPKLRILFPERVSSRWLALRLVDGDQGVVKAIVDFLNQNLQ